MDSGFLVPNCSRKIFGQLNLLIMINRLLTNSFSSTLYLCIEFLFLLLPISFQGYSLVNNHHSNRVYRVPTELMWIYEVSVLFIYNE